MAECGTYAAVSMHKKLGQPLDQACKAAAAEYMRNRRASQPGVMERDRWLNSTRRHALERLATEHPARFFELLTEERAGEW